MMFFINTWVSHPRVENPVRLLRPEGLFVVDATSQHLFAEGDNVRSFGQIKVLKCPHLAGGTSSGLNFVNHVGDVVSGANLLQSWIGLSSRNSIFNL